MDNAHNLQWSHVQYKNNYFALFFIFHSEIILCLLM